MELKSYKRLYLDTLQNHTFEACAKEVTANNLHGGVELRKGINNEESDLYYISHYVISNL